MNNGCCVGASRGRYVLNQQDLQTECKRHSSFTIHSLATNINYPLHSPKDNFLQQTYSLLTERILTANLFFINKLYTKHSVFHEEDPILSLDMASIEQNSAPTAETGAYEFTSNPEIELPEKFSKYLEKLTPYQGIKFSIKADDRRENKQLQKLRKQKHGYKNLVDDVKEAMEELKRDEGRGKQGIEGGQREI